MGVLDARNLAHISIHAPREGSDAFPLDGRCHLDISIHAPREGSDAFKVVGAFRVSGFLSTLPARGATPLRGLEVILLIISIHAPREGSDLPLDLVFVCLHISIHAPREGSDSS